MDFNKHSNLVGSHAFLSASSHSWINYDEDKLVRMYTASLAARRGTELHTLAHDLIRLGVKLPKVPKTLNLYVNDGIGFRMKTEQVLYFSPNCYGTADSIRFSEREMFLRIHDLKNGLTEASMDQLYIYAAFFCLEYGFRPVDIRTELRIYQNDEVRIEEADPHRITFIMSKIVTFDKQINAIRLEAQS
jgi:hypothetical protein